MFIKKIYYIIILLILLSTLSACDKKETIHNSQIAELIKNTENLTYVENVDVYKMGFNLIVDVYVKEDFMTHKNRNDILNLAKECFDEKTINNIKEEFKQECPPDTSIYIRNKEGSILIDYIGSCYDSSSKIDIPKRTNYIWTQTEW